MKGSTELVADAAEEPGLDGGSGRSNIAPVGPSGTLPKPAVRFCEEGTVDKVSPSEQGE